MRNLTRSALLTSLLVVTLVPSIGCTGLLGKDKSGKPLSKRMPWSKDKDKPEPYPNPTRMAATWTPDTLVQTGRTPTRGFGGRLFFYDEKTKAVPVEGELTVHAFADSADGGQGEVKRYHFTAEQFTSHFSQTDLGASYSVWIPWDAVGGEHTRISLVPSFRTASGRLVQGEQAVVALPGRRTSVENIASRPTAATLLEATRKDAKSGLVTTTIPVKSGLSRGGSYPQPGSFGAPPASDAIAAQPKRTVQSFDVAPLGQPLVEKTLPALVAAEPATYGSRPPRLGQGNSGLSNAAPSNVMRASATLPLE